METLELLSDLVAFPTVSRRPNRDLIDYCAGHLSRAGARIEIIEGENGRNANLFASLGPEESGGVVLSGHTDVVPVEGQDWSRDPFAATVDDGRVYGRGTADMKGFVAASIRIAQKAASVELKTPLHLAFSYDEEIGCVGVRSMINRLEHAPFRPGFCIVGEPTLMGVATGHKGKTGFRVTTAGQEAHSALAPTGLNAIYLATDMIDAIRALQKDIMDDGALDDDYDVSYTTLHVGTIEGGTALNIVPNRAEFLAEIRNLAGDDPEKILEELKRRAAGIVAPLKPEFPGADVRIEVFNTYPPLDTPADAGVVSFVKSLTGSNSTFKVAFGTEGGLFSDTLGVPTVICGPGSMAQGHKPDEFVSVEQLALCDRMLDNLLDRLVAGL